ncbi:hypothetical protein [Cellulomonas fimi]|uniref:Uncharacterized protein n=1 Tax=Cellulomonas fimi (strain ATCC 484 / DSM 20113 / JCM 1341 / CCUG 24087 / LMG 16345 / NBRC 15513 / NCIMB 8980 / NCTC 7547 / NRS-133) TaxID=590998 RepID=F4H477_CELFA|nr:hypothetical protein [Cellulomonas fimi]AEE45429.1 hypothetical protein Celf_1294 [Cellulomonas fimi ATCC 484]VEH29363.1 Uncharacterised protein [Cellulomonas fimi]
MSAAAPAPVTRRDARTPLVLVLVAIGWVTVASGAAQVLAPGFVLSLLGATDDATTRQLFATVGMFMVVVGGLLLTTLSRPRHDPDVVLWAAVQKAGAAVAVTVGVARGVLDPLALAVAAFDLVTALLLALHLRGLRGAR